MGTSFPYGVCRLCGSDPPINSVVALLMPSFIELTHSLLGIKISDTDKCSKLVCKSCVNIVRNFGVFASTVKATQLIIEQFISFNDQMQENEAAESALKLRDENVVLISDDSSSDDETLAQLVLSPTVAHNPDAAQPMVVIPSASIISYQENAEKRSDCPKEASETKNIASLFNISPTSHAFEPKRRKTISTSIPQDYTILKTKCVSCGVFVKTSFELALHKHVHEKGTCLYCMEEIASEPEIMYHFMQCFLAQCHIVDVLSCYMKNFRVRITQTQGGQPAAPVPLSANIAVVSKPHSKRPKHEVNDTLLISKKQVELLKHQNITLNSSTHYIPVTLGMIKDTEKCTVLGAELSRTSVRYRLQKEKIPQQYENFKFLWNVQKIHALKPKNQGETLVASAESNNGNDIVNSESSPCPAQNEALLEDIHIRMPNKNSRIKQPRTLTKASNTPLPTSSIDLLTDSSDDEVFPSFFKSSNAVVKQYKGISSSNELRSLSTPMQVTQNIDTPIYCSNAPSTSQSTITLEKSFSTLPSYLPVLHSTNTNTEKTSCTAIVGIPASINLRYDPISPSILHCNSKTHLPKTADALTSDAETISKTKYRSIQPKPSKPTKNRLYDSMLMKMSSTIVNTNSAALPGLSSQSWQPHRLPFSVSKEPLLNSFEPNLEPAYQQSNTVINVMPNDQQSLDRLHILSPQDINNRIS